MYISFAVPAYREPITKQQPDGSEVTFLLFGDEHFSYKTTLDGFLIVEDNQDYLTYGEVDSNGVVRSLGVRVSQLGRRTVGEKAFILNLKPASSYSSILSEVANTRRSLGMQRVVSSSTLQRAYPLNGTPRSLVILVNFSDKSFVVSNPQEAYTNLLNQENYSANGGTGSAKDYFRDNSNGAFSPQFDVVGPYTLPNSMAYYGGNSSSPGSDQNARQMVIDACSLASANGVDVAQYDTDNNGFVDNIFIYYAGYNEAEGGPTNSVWPHRWVLANTSTVIDGKIIYDYACTSELRGASGSNMCGIGTFCHEFGHVLGLPDFYATNDAAHHTLYTWDIMDAGPYNNLGRTPPSYSGYERFFLGWMTPTEIKSGDDFTLEPLNTSNKAFLISLNGNHNLVGKSPSPSEFFIVENRQKTKWDTYLPGHGLLITRVNYSSSTWSANTVNNTSSAMGVDIMEADGLATDASSAGDTYPGTSNVTSFSPTSRSGTNYSKPITDITEANGIITLKFMGGVFVPGLAPVASEATNISTNSFTANWNASGQGIGYLIDVFRLNGTDTIYVDGFRSKSVGKVVNYDVTGLDAAADYFYRIRTTNGSLASVNSNVVGVTTNPFTMDMFKPRTTEATNISSSSFTANWAWGSDKLVPDRYELTLYEKKINGKLDTLVFGFADSEIPSGWSSSASTFPATSGYYFPSPPAMYFNTNADYFQTSLFEKSLEKFSFWYRAKGISSTNSLFVYSSEDGSTWELVRTVQPLVTKEGGETISLTASQFSESHAVKLVYSKSESGSVTMDNMQFFVPASSDSIVDRYNALNVGNVTSHNITGLSPNSTYYYQVVAYNNNASSQQSNKTTVVTTADDETSISNIGETMSVVKIKGGIEVRTTNSLSNNLEILNIQGRILFKANFNNYLLVPSGILPSGIYLIKVNNLVKKLVL